MKYSAGYRQYNNIQVSSPTNASSKPAQLWTYTIVDSGAIALTMSVAMTAYAVLSF